MRVRQARNDRDSSDDEAVTSKAPKSGSTSGRWELKASDIAICSRPDGREWLLGQGAFGKVCPFAQCALLAGNSVLVVRSMPVSRLYRLASVSQAHGTGLSTVFFDRRI